MVTPLIVHPSVAKLLRVSGATTSTSIASIFASTEEKLGVGGIWNCACVGVLKVAFASGVWTSLDMLAPASRMVSTLFRRDRPPVALVLHSIRESDECVFSSFTVAGTAGVSEFDRGMDGLKVGELMPR